MAIYNVDDDDHHNQNRVQNPVIKLTFDNETNNKHVWIPEFKKKQQKINIFHQTNSVCLDITHSKYECVCVCVCNESMKSAK